jgi:plasmid stabilization system protein ParE
MRVYFSDAAEADLDDIGDWIAEDNPLRAAAFTQRLRERCAKLGNMPQAYPLVPRHEASRIRRCPFRDYLIFYRVRTEAVEVLHILHGARDIDALLFPSD